MEIKLAGVTVVNKSGFFLFLTKEVYEETGILKIKYMNESDSDLQFILNV